jgi:hypothetical protein
MHSKYFDNNFDREILDLLVILRHVQFRIRMKTERRFEKY